MVKAQGRGSLIKKHLRYFRSDIMETKTTYLIHQLCEESVIIEKTVTAEWNGNIVKLEETRTDYPNQDYGIEAFRKAVYDERIISAVEAVFGIKGGI